MIKHSSKYFMDKAEDQLKVGGDTEKALVLAILAQAAAEVEAAKLRR